MRRDPRRDPADQKRCCCGSEQPLVLILLPASLNLLDTWPRRNTTAAMTARAMRATRRMYSTMLAPRSSFVNLACSQVRNTNRFIYWPLLESTPYGSWERAGRPQEQLSAGSSGRLSTLRANPAQVASVTPMLVWLVGLRCCWWG